MSKPDDIVMKAWKQQLGIALRLAETVMAESKKFREYEVAAAAEAQAAAVAARERLQAAANMQDLWRAQGEWMQAGVERSAAYWRKTYEAATQLQAAATRCMYEPAEPASAGTSNLELFGMLDEAYKRWLETTSRFYAAPAAARSTARKAA